MTYSFVNGAVGVGGCHGDRLQGLCGETKEGSFCALKAIGATRRHPMLRELL